MSPTRHSPPPTAGSAPLPWHRTVLAAEAVDLLAVRPGGRYADGTAGGGGHLGLLLERCAPDGRVLGLDRDPAALARCRERLGPAHPHLALRRANFAELPRVAREEGLLPLDGVLLDLGVSSYQLDTAERGFAIAHDGPLDMRMDPDHGETAAELIRRLSEGELGRLLRKLGEEPAARRVARAIKAADARGELRGTADLARVVAGAKGSRGRRQRIHPATQTFQALRLAVNDELGALQRFLDGLLDLLVPGGRVAVIAFHSLEDRLVKRHFARLVAPCTCPPDLPLCCCGKTPSLALVTRKAVKPGQEEIEANPRARSARLRVARRLAPAAAEAGGER